MMFSFYLFWLFERILAIVDKEKEDTLNSLYLAFVLNIQVQSLARRHLMRKRNFNGNIVVQWTFNSLLVYLFE